MLQYPYTAKSLDTALTVRGTTRKVRFPVRESIPKLGKEGRYLRGIDLFWGAAFERISRDPEVWVVESTYGSINEVEVDRGTCSCRDFEFHTHQHGAENFMCKHRHAVDMKRRWFKTNARELSGFFGGEAA